MTATNSAPVSRPRTLRCSVLVVLSTTGRRGRTTASPGNTRSPWSVPATPPMSRPAWWMAATTACEWPFRQPVTEPVETIGADTVLIDSTGLDRVSVDSTRRGAVVGCGARWSTVNAAAQVHGLLGRAGTAPDWAAGPAGVGPDVTSRMSLLHAPPAPPFPEDLRGSAVLHLALASTGGEAAGRPLLQALDEVGPPDVNTIGPADAGRLSLIHLDPPCPVASIGDGRWLSSAAAGIAGRVLRAADIESGSALSMVELRHVSSEAPVLPGAMTSPGGAFLLHAVGLASETNTAAHIEEALERVRAAARPVDVGRTAVGFRDGQPDAVGALSPGDAERLAATGRAVDPDGVFDLGRIGWVQ